MVDYLRNKRGVKVPIIPGVMPILKTEQIKRITSLCGAHVPPELMGKLEAHASDDDAVRQIGVENATQMSRELLARGVIGIHFYCLNRVPSVRQVLHNLKVG